MSHVPQVLHVPNSFKDARFANNVLVSHGFPLARVPIESAHVAVIILALFSCTRGLQIGQYISGVDGICL